MRRTRPGRPRRPAFQAAHWLWTPIPASPVLAANSALWAGYLSAAGTQHTATLHEFGITLVPASAITMDTPRYDIAFANVPAWGPDPFGSYTVPIPDGTAVPSTPGGDNQLAVIDPLTGMSFGLWQASKSGSVWSASWGGMAFLGSDGIETAGSTTATALARYAGVIGADELTAAIAANTGLKHALFCATDISSAAFVAPAIKADGTNQGAVATPIPQGHRIQLDPTITVDSIAGITAAEKVIAKTLQTYGAYIGDKGSSRLSFAFEYQTDGNPGAKYTAAGLGWDYYDLNKIPWASLRVLRNWDGTGPTFTDRKASRATSYSLTGSYTKIALSTVDATYPATVLVSGGIQIADYTGPIKIVLDCTTQGAASGYQQIFRPYVNDVAAGTENAATRGVRHAEWTISVLAGDVVSIYGYRTGTSSVDAGTTVLITLP